MLICKDCGKVIADDELITHLESRGEFWGNNCFEEIVDKCECGGEFVEAKQCQMCGEWICEDDENVCDDCLQNNATYDNALKYGEENKESVELNGFLANVFTADEVNEILIRELDEAQQLSTKIYKEARWYCLNDKMCFIDFLTGGN